MQDQLTTEHIREQVERRKAEEAAAIPADQETKKNGRITTKFIKDCLNADELGHGLLYAAVHRGRFLYDNTTGQWLVFEDHSWRQDHMNKSLAGVEDVVDLLIDELQKITGQIVQAAAAGDSDKVKSLRREEKRLLYHIGQLRKDRGRTVCLKMARTCKTPLAIRGDELDLDPWLLACANGVLDLRTGKFGPGRPEQLISKASPISWEGLDASAKLFEISLLESLNGRDQVVSFLQRVLGYCLTGLSREHIFIVFAGEGRNGKSTLVECIKHVLGPLSAPVQCEMLLDQGRMKSSSGPSPDLMALRGLRIAFASETDEGRRFSPGRVKWLSGGDSIVARDLQSKQTYFAPTHKLILSTNHRPHAPGDDFAFWERLLLINFDLKFVEREVFERNERPVKKGLADQLKTESPGILAWLVRGCLFYQNEGLKPPKEILEATAEYRKAEDLLGEYLDACCQKVDLAVTSAKDLYSSFCTWFSENISEKTTVKQKRFGELLGRRFERKPVNGYAHYVGIKIK